MGCYPAPWGRAAAVGLLLPGPKQRLHCSSGRRYFHLANICWKSKYFSTAKHLKNVRTRLREILTKFVQTNAGLRREDSDLLSTLLGTFCHVGLPGDPALASL